MRLLKLGCHGSVQLAKDLPVPVPPYAILSHTWGPDKDEVTLDDIHTNHGQDKAGFAKILSCGQQAKRDGLAYFWVDTCCIDKRNVVELAEAINSMFDWYRDAQKCYVHLADVPAPSNKRDHDGKETWEAAFLQSRWHTRGWTLQELLAPAIVQFFSQDWYLLGDKATLSRHLQNATGVPLAALSGMPLMEFTVEERMRWAEKRQTTKLEDKWYSLMGIFGVHMSLIYGEGGKAEGPTEEQDRQSLQSSAGCEQAPV